MTEPDASALRPLDSPITINGFNTMHTLLSRLFLFTFLLFANLCGATAEEYWQKAKESKLWQERYWHLLLHYNGDESEIDDSDFFLSETGKSDPKEEMRATLFALLNEKRLDDNATGCRFPARREYLARKLEINDDLPKIECREFDEIMEELSPRSVTVVFPTAHINSPASMFGHTFLMINSRYNSRLLSYAVNYAADADENSENAIVFAFKGLFGGYEGRYSLLPYYEKLKEYRDTESRDIWEYDLNLDRNETMKMVRHIWELNGINSTYYFFTENCSYNLLWLVEIARPDVRLRERFTYQVIPLETIHVMREEGLLADVNYRASKRTTLLRYEEEIKKEYLDYPVLLAGGDIPPKSLFDRKNIPLDQRQKIYEAAIELLQFRYIQRDVPKEEYLERFHTLSKVRAKLGIGKELAYENREDPLKGHRAARVRLSFGYRDSGALMVAGWRPAYHDTKDPRYGFMRGTQIEFLDLAVGIEESKGVSLERATLIGVESIATVSRFFTPVSWRLKAGWDRDFFVDGTRFGLQGGIGYATGGESGYGYLLLEPIVYLSDMVRAAIGAKAGMKLYTGKKSALHLQLSRRMYENGFTQNLVGTSFTYVPKRGWQTGVEFEYKQRLRQDTKKSEETLLFTLRRYF